MARSMKVSSTRLNEHGGINYYMTYGTPAARVTACLRYGRHTIEDCSLYFQNECSSEELDNSDLKTLFEAQANGNILAPQIWTLLIQAYKERTKK